ncbi:hypothetical protein Cgig2_015545 [Carnegiea gigantea]|uniref:Uncharacterized protein n=1 Tax=Carnegiea gigantea TaxID=171969 RepID=A0A9Q1GKB4_9CARY|nr:hypothetical protein Cgig2_015545 [Carnegiea gigantea]
MVKKGACKICGRYGHEDSICYEVIGYPPGWGSRGRGRGSRGGPNMGGGGRLNGKGRAGLGRETAAAAVQHEGGPLTKSPSDGPLSVSNSDAGPVTMDQETSASPTTSLPAEIVRRREGLDPAQSSPRGTMTNQDRQAQMNLGPHSDLPVFTDRGSTGDDGELGPATNLDCMTLAAEAQSDPVAPGSLPST